MSSKQGQSRMGAKWYAQEAALDRAYSERWKREHGIPSDADESVKPAPDSSTEAASREQAQ